MNVRGKKMKLVCFYGFIIVVDRCFEADFIISIIKGSETK